MFSQDLLEFFDTLHKFIPSLSTGGFIRTLEKISADNARVPVINQTTFMKSFEEYRYMRLDILKLKKHPLLQCPACFEDHHSMHVDGNRKLYRFSKVPRGIRTLYYKDLFICKNEEVDAHLQQVGYRDDTATGMCGTTRWKAAKATSKTMRNLDETGLVVAGCHHTLALKVVNMFRGELFGYTHFLHTGELCERNVKFMWQDVVCQYFPWSERVNFDCPEALDMKPCLPIMHLKAHSWHCQILWGGRWQDGAGSGSGEDMELLFSYLSQWAFPTRNMLAYRREEFLTEAVIFWNDRKIRPLPRTLVHRLRKCQEKLLAVEGQMNVIGLPQAILELYKQEIVAAAKRTQHLYKEANSIMSKSAENLTKLQALESKLQISDGNNRKDCLHQGKKLAIQRKLQDLQGRMELYYLSIKRKLSSIKSVATSSKQRTNLRRSVSSEKRKLSTCITEYNALGFSLRDFILLLLKLLWRGTSLGPS
ncbi:uncharacterized protein [Dysidea avara]|uniref:uncharacterized protein isoform X2 n=1 Tax=Dysidea avara TaxID=196820 RepID=UPI00333305F8